MNIINEGECLRKLASFVVCHAIIMIVRSHTRIYAYPKTLNVLIQIQVMAVEKNLGLLRKGGI